MKGRMGTDYSYDLCILDWNMPVMNGMEVAQKIREEYGKEINSFYNLLSNEIDFDNY